MKIFFRSTLLKNSVLAVCGVAAVLALSFIAWKELGMRLGVDEPPRLEIRIHGKELFVDVASIPETRTRGLSGRPSLPVNAGMLFIFDSPQIATFWMKDMHFSLDIIWIDEKLRVADITKNITPNTFPDSFSPEAPVQYVLEVNAGFTDAYSIGIGDQVEGIPVEK